MFAYSMLFDASHIFASTTPSVTSLMTYTLQPIVQTGFVVIVSVLVVAVAYNWIIKRGVRGAGRAIMR